MLLSSAFTILLICVAAVRCGGKSEGDGMSHSEQPHAGFGNVEGGSCLLPVMPGLVVTPLKRFYQDGETMDISCEEGYELKASRPNSTCRVFSIFGQYGVFMPVITTYTCTALPMCRPPLRHGVKVSPQKAFYEIGETITIGCDEGYEQVGDKTFTCRKESDYYGVYVHAKFDVGGQRICREIRDCPVLIQSGLNVEPFKMTYKPGEKVLLSCDDDYDLATANVSVCQKSGQFQFARKADTDSEDGEWQIDHFILTSSACRRKARCTPPVFPGLLVSPMKDSYVTGEEISLSCKEDYELTSPNKSTCEHKAYANNPSYFGIIDNMPVLGKFKPQPRFKTCTPKPKCFAAITRGVVVSPAKESYTEGETIRISCADGYELNGEAVSTCTRDSHEEGFQSARFRPDTRNACKKKQSCKFPRTRGVVLTPEKKVYDVGETVAVSCDLGYVLKKFDTSVCQRRNKRGDFKSGRIGQFSPRIDGNVCEKILSCEKPEYEGLVIAPEKKIFEIGDKITMSCEDGYEQRVAPSSTCMRTGQRGRFDPNLTKQPCRKLTSCKIPDDENLIVSPVKESYDEGDKITLSCKKGYSRIASETMTCERAQQCRGQKVKGCFYPAASDVLCKKLKRKEGAGENLKETEMGKNKMTSQTTTESFPTSTDTQKTISILTEEHESTVATHSPTKQDTEKEE